MKAYAGDHETKGVVVWNEDDQSIKLLGRFAWGDKRQPRLVSALAKALLVDLIGEPKATRYYRRFMYRTVFEWPADTPWKVSDEELLTVVKEIEDVERETAPDRRRMAREVPKGLMIDSGTATSQMKGAFSAPAWSKDPSLTPNPPPKEKS